MFHQDIGDPRWTWFPLEIIILICAGINIHKAKTKTKLLIRWYSTKIKAHSWNHCVQHHLTCSLLQLWFMHNDQNYHAQGEEDCWTCSISLLFRLEEFRVEESSWQHFTAHGRNHISLSNQSSILHSDPHAVNIYSCKHLLHCVLTLCLSLLITMRTTEKMPLTAQNEMHTQVTTMPTDDENWFWMRDISHHYHLLNTGWGSDTAATWSLSCHNKARALFFCPLNKKEETEVKSSWGAHQQGGCQRQKWVCLCPMPTTSMLSYNVSKWNDNHQARYESLLVVLRVKVSL